MATTLLLTGYKKKYFTDGTKSQSAVNSTIDVTQTLSKTGTKTPNYRQLVDAGQLLPVQSYNVSSVKNGVAKFVQFRKVARWITPVAGSHIDTIDMYIPLGTSSLSLAGVNQLYATERSAADNTAKLELQQRIENLKWDSLVDIGEAKKTSNLS